MKRKLAVVSLGMVMALAAWAQVPPLLNYQGKLVSGTNLVTGEVDMRLRVYNSPTEAIMLMCEDSGRVSVVDGIYSTTLGDNITYGDMSWTRMNGGFWIELAINSVTMAPREKVVSVAYAMTAGAVTNNAIDTMMIGNGVVMNANLADNAVDGAKIQDGSVTFGDINQSSATNGQIMKWNGSAWVAASDLTSGGGTLASYAESGAFSPSPLAAGMESIAQGRGTRAEGDNSVVGGGYSNTVGYGAHYAAIGGGEQNSIGDTAYNSAIGGGYRGTILAASRYAFIGGGFLNEIYGGASYATIAGGYQNDIMDNADYGFVGGGFGNEVGADAYHGAVVGGYQNEIGANATNAFIGGGRYNAIGSLAQHATIAGGYSNVLSDSAVAATIGGGYENGMGNADYSTIAGGAANRIENLAQYSVIGGGIGNDISPSSSYAVVSGGQNNDIGANADWAVIPGGKDNVANGAYSFAAGRGAQALHSGTFVWADNQEEPFASSNANTFLIRASGGVGIGTVQPTGDLQVVGQGNLGSVVISPPGFLDGDSQLMLSEDRYGWYGVRLRYEHTNNEFQIYGHEYGVTHGPHLVLERDSGYVGIGRAPAARLDVAGGVISGNGYFPLSAADGANLLNLIVGSTADGGSNGISFRESSTYTGMALGYDGTRGSDSNALRVYDAYGNPLVAMESGGDVGIGVISPDARLHLNGGCWDVNETEGDFKIGGDSNRFKIGVALSGGGAGIVRMTAQGGKQELRLGAGTNDVLIVYTNRVSVPLLEVTGGADLAEPFPINGDKQVAPGTILVIDEATPGQLKPSETAYDHRVAGVVSGAGGVVPGITLVQEGQTERGVQVALTGRAYAMANASNGPIRAGDLLTTSSEPGQAMRATDPARSQGAILGKAMSSLESGSGLVLVLVNLQ